MSVTELIREKALETLKELSGEKLKVAFDFIEYLKEKEEMEATLEILSSRELVAQIREAEKALKAQRMEDFIPWGQVKRDV